MTLLDPINGTAIYIEGKMKKKNKYSKDYHQLQEIETQNVA
jgi:hypothetical protein